MSNKMYCVNVITAGRLIWHTDFKGIADITTNGKIKWKDVPIVIHVLNGNTINFNIESTKTEDHFKGLPVFGTVESIVDQNGKELLKL